jgi:iron complex outermembrane receptor protein
MKMKKVHKLHQWLLSLVLCFGLSVAFAQDRTVSGKVKDENGEAMPGVSVLIKGTTSGTSTDLDGNYRLNLPQGATTLVISFVGYRTKEVDVATSTTIDVQLELDVEQLEEVVVVGYGELKKSDVTGAVTTISTKDFNKGAINSPQDLIVGRTAGVQVTTAGGAPGAGATIRVRGTSSLFGDANPLIIIDGIPIDNDVRGIRNPLSTINPNDIETFTVLKDASATAIYGSRASNGVILITTKRGKAGSPTKFNYTSTFSLYTIRKQIDNLSAEEFRSLVTTKYGANSDQAKLLTSDANTSTDWQDEIFDNSVGHEHNFGVSGSFKTLPYRLALGYTNQNGILKKSAFERFNASIALDPTFLNDNLKVSINGKYSKTGSDFSDEGAIGSAITFDPTKPVKTNDNLFGGYYYWGANGITSSPIHNGAVVNLSPANPVALIEQNSNTAVVGRFIGNVQTEYKLPFLQGLKAVLNLATDRSNTDGKRDVAQDAAFRYEAEFTGVDGKVVPFEKRGGFRQRYEEEKKNDLLDFYFNYNKQLNDKHRVDATLGYSWQHFWFDNKNYENNTWETRAQPVNIHDKGELFLVSFFGRLNYTFSNKYTFTFTARNDGTSRFAEGNQWGLFPSAAFAWQVKDEAFLKDVTFLSDLKFRLGYGATGQQGIGNYYAALGRVNRSQNTAQYQIGNQYVPMIRFEGFNGDLKWETAVTYNVGLDYGFWDNRITGSLEYYVRRNEDLLNNVTAPAGTNFSNIVADNIGTLENRGLEFSLNARIVEKTDFTWSAGFNITRNQNEIKKLTRVSDPNYRGELVGGITGATGTTVQIHSVGHPASSYFVFEQVYGEDGKPIEGMYVDRNQDGKIDDFDKYQYKNPAPSVFMGFNSRLTYKKFDFSFNARMNVNNYVYNNVFSNLGQYQNVSVLNGFINNSIPDIYNTNFNTPRYLSDYYVRNATFFRMDNMTVGYSLDKVFSEKLNVYLSATIQNAFVITKYDGLDPEVDGGIDNNIYPRPRTFLLNVNVNF